MSKKSFAALYAKVAPTTAYQAEKLAVGFLAELTALMQAHEVTNAELARRVGVSPAYITKVFRGPSNLSIETLAKLADAVGGEVRLRLARHKPKAVAPSARIAASPARPTGVRDRPTPARPRVVSQAPASGRAPATA